MSFRFWQRIRLAPGVTLNLSKSTASLSFGPRGAKVTLSPRGNRVTVGLPGTGLFYTVHQPRSRKAAQAAKMPAGKRLSPGFFRRLLMPKEERALIEGVKALNAGDEAAALATFEQAQSLPDAAWMAGMLRIKREDFAAARRHFDAALARGAELGKTIEKYGLAVAATLSVTPDVEAHLRPSVASTLLALIEIAQLTGNQDEALARVEALLELAPEDPVARVSFAELVLEGAADRARLERIVAMTDGVQNETPLDTALLLYRARALNRLGLAEAALAVLTHALRRRAGRAEALLRQLRYERALLLETLGRKAEAWREFARINAEDPGFADVRARLGHAPPEP